MNRRLFSFGLMFLACQSIAAAEPDGDDSTGGKCADTNTYLARLAWHRKTIVQGYDTAGKHDPKWDKPVRTVLEDWALIRTDANTFPSAKVKPFKEVLAATAQLGCDDPLVAYVRDKFSTTSEVAKGVEARAQEAVRLAEDLQRSRYSPWLKFYAHLRAAQALTNAVALNTNLQRELLRQRYDARTNLWDVIREGAAPVEEVYSAFEELLNHVHDNASLFEKFYARLEPDWFRNYGRHYLPWLLKGRYYVRYAWKARGTAMAFQVPDSAWPLFQQRLDTANAALEKAWSMNSNDAQIAVYAMGADHGMSRGREVMEKWFQRAMTADPGCFDACRQKVVYLEPKWYGSAEEMLAFGNECVTSRIWKGSVPLTLAYAHERLVRYLPKAEAPKYWLRPEVWQDIKKCYDTVFLRYSAVSRQRAEFAQHAYTCEQWEEFLRQSALIRERHHFLFGGKEELDRMIRRAKEKVAKPDQ